MYIWIACSVDDSYTDARRRALKENESLMLDTKAFSLPAHISLKISFFVPDDLADNVITTVREYLINAPHFSVHNPKIEQNGSILWIGYSPCEELEILHRELDQLLLDRHGIEQHPFDRCFKFHTTLFIDERVELVSLMRERLSDLVLPDIVPVGEYIIGTSDSGKAGEYSVKFVI